MLSQWLLLSDGASSTEDIYFKCVEPALARSGIKTMSIDTRRVWPIFCAATRRIDLSRTNILIVRSIHHRWLDWLEKHQSQFRQVVYLVDDDIVAAACDTQLPESYRQRMKGIAEQIQPRILALADEVVVSSNVLLQVMRRHHNGVTRLNPAMLLPSPGVSHWQDSRYRLGFHGTRAHLLDLNSITPALTSFLESFSSCHLDIMLGRFTPEALARLPQVTAIPPLKWSQFIEYQKSARLHVGVVPLLSTPFNLSKSWIKVLDIAAMGGVGVYSRRAPYEEVIEDGRNGLLVGDDPGEWRVALQRLKDYPLEALAMAQEAQKLAAEVGDISAVVNFWSSRSQ